MYRCTVDGRPEVACAPPHVDVGGLAPGEHALVIVGTDHLGNVGPPVTVRWTQLASNAPLGPPDPLGPAAAPSGSPPPRAAPRATVLPAAARRRLLRDARATVRSLARRGPGLARVTTVTFASTLPLTGRVRTTLRRGSHTIGTGTLTLRRTGTFRLRVKLSAAGRRALRRAGGRLELRVGFTPGGGRATSVRASATRRR